MLGLLLQLAFMIAAQVPMSGVSETIDVNVVEVDAVVLDAQGKPVAGLTKNDFDLRVGGRRRPISNFYAIDRRLEQAGAPASAIATAKDRPAEAARRDYLVLFVDDAHLHQFQRKRALDALKKFVSGHVHPGTSAMLVRSNGDVRIVERFTEDPVALIAEIEAMEREPAHESVYESDRRDLLRFIESARTEPHAKEQLAEIARERIATVASHEQRRTEMTIGALDQVAHSIAGLDGRRVLVYVSDGLPMQPAAEIWENFKWEEFLDRSSSDRAKRAVGQMQGLDAMSVNLSSQFLDLARRSASAGVQIFSIDAHGLGTYDDFMRDSTVSMRVDSARIRSNFQEPLHLLADETGGRAITDQNSMDAAFAQLGDHLSTYYSLGFRSDSSDREEDVDVRVKRRGVTVHAVKHIRQRSTREQIADRVRAALYTRLEENPLDARVAVAAGGGAKNGVDAMIRVPVPKLSIQPEATSGGVAYAVFVAMLDQDNRETPVRMFVHRIKPAEEEESVQQLNLQADPGTYTISFAVVDGYSWQASYLQREVTIPK